MRFAHTIDDTTPRVFRKLDRHGRFWHQDGSVQQREVPIWDNTDPENPVQTGSYFVDEWVEDDPPTGRYLTATDAAVYDWYPVDDDTNSRPADTVDTYYTSSYTFDTVTFTRVWNAVAKSQEQQDEEAAEAAARAAQDADDADRDTKGATVGGAVATLRAWADDAEATTVDSGNAVATLQTVVDRLGVFFDRFADLIEYQRIDKV